MAGKYAETEQNAKFTSFTQFPGQQKPVTLNNASD